MSEDKDIEFTEIEEQASDRGWSPEKEWEGDKDQWVDASTFVRQGELMDRISTQTKQLKSQSSEIGDLKVAMQSLAETNKKIAENEYEKAIRDLKSQKTKALEDYDTSTIVEIDEQIASLRDAKKESEQLPPQKPANITHPDVVEWIDKNAWYESDVIMRGAADSLAAEYINLNPSLKDDPKSTLDYVERELKKEFPHKFNSRKRPSATLDSDDSSVTKTKSSKKTKYTERHLTAEQKKVVQTIVATGIMTKQEYIDQLGELGELEG